MQRKLVTWKNTINNENTEKLWWKSLRCSPEKQQQKKKENKKKKEKIKKQKKKNKKQKKELLFNAKKIKKLVLITFY